MHGKTTSLVVSSHPEQVSNLVTGLERLAVSVNLVGTVTEANSLLALQDPPLLVWSEVTLADGTWLDLLARTQKCANAPNVIVVAHQVDVSLYVETINQGAFDFVVTPMPLADLAYVFRGAAENALNRRNAGYSASTPADLNRGATPKAPLPSPPKVRIKKPRPQTLPPMAYNSVPE